MHKFERIGELSVGMAQNMERASNCGVMTVPIVGVPRGGTTMVAAVVDALGIYLGPQGEMNDFHFEDQAMHSPDLETQYKGIRKRNVKHRVWGWKDPTGIHSVQSVVYALRNPHVIVVFRDVLASIQGEMRFDEKYGIDPPRTFEQLAATSDHWWAGNMRFITHTQFPIYLVSYERAINNPELFIHELEKFLQLKPTEEQRAEAVSRISRSGGYLRPDSCREKIETTAGGTP